MAEVIHGEVVPVAVAPIAEAEVTVVLRITTVAAVTMDGTAPATGTVEAGTMAIPGRPVTIPDGTPGKMIARLVATSGTILTKIHETVVPRIVRGLVRIILLREEVAEITAAEAAPEIITVGMVVVQAVAVALPVGTMMVAAHPTTNVAMSIIHRRLAAVVAALVVIGWIIAAVAGDAVAVIDPGNRWDRQGRSLHEPPEAVVRRWVIDRRWVRGIRSRSRLSAGDRLEVGLLVVSGTMGGVG